MHSPHLSLQHPANPGGPGSRWGLLLPPLHPTALSQRRGGLLPGLLPGLTSTRRWGTGRRAKTTALVSLGGGAVMGGMALHTLTSSSSSSSSAYSKELLWPPRVPLYPS